MDIMIDLETFSTRTHACILILSAIRFDRKDSIVELNKMDTFYSKICFKSCVEKNMHVDEKTVQWWKDQPENIKNEIFSEDRETLEIALKRFTEWFKKDKNFQFNRVWSHGATFDIPILTEAFTRCNMETPWKFWFCRDTRTLFEICNLQVKDLPSENLHNALWDCWRQVWGVKKCFNNLNINSK